MREIERHTTGSIKATVDTTFMWCKPSDVEKLEKKLDIAIDGISYIVKFFKESYGIDDYGLIDYCEKELLKLKE